MAEAFGFARSIISLIQLTAQIISSIHAYVGKVQRTPDDIHLLVDELCSLNKTLMILQHGFATSPCSVQPKLQQLDAINTTLHECLQGLQQLASKLEPTENRKFLGIMGYLRWPLKEKETRHHVSIIERQRGLCLSILTSNQMLYSSEVIELRVPSEHEVHDLRVASPVLNSLNKESTLDTGEEDEFIHIAFRGRKNSTDVRISEEERKQVFSWLRCGDYKRHLDIRQQRLKKTGNWLLEDPEFQEWKEQRSFRLIWGCGIPGAGKTFLSSMVIDHLESQATAGDFGVAHIYFDYQDQEQQEPVYVLASLVEQLSRQRPNLSTNIESLYSDLKPKGGKPSINELYDILLRTSRSFHRVFFVFDALDECNQSQRKFLLPLFRRMERDGISIFLTSRPYPEDIQNFLRVAVKIEISAKGEDIGMYIQQKIDEDPRAGILGNCRDKIIAELVECARGMFLLARFHMAYICQQTSTKQILIALEKIRDESSSVVKRPLDPIYDRAIENIRKQRKSCVRLATKVLSWLLLTRRALTLDELRTAVSVEPNRYRLGELELPDKETLLEVCDNLVTIGEHSNTVHLAHYTVQEYLLRNSIVTDAGNLEYELASTCITYLSSDTFAVGTSFIQDLQNSCPFLNYTVHYLSSHIKSCNEYTSTNSSVVLALAILKFLVSSGNISTYLQALCAQKEWYYRYGTHIPFWDSSRNEYLRLHVASAIGSHVVVQLLLEGANLSITDNNGWGVFILAKGTQGHEAVAKLLLDDRAHLDILAKDDHGQTALHVAASEGHTTIVQLLLEKGSDLSASDNDGRTALHMAAFRGHEEVVRILIYNGADVSALDSSGKAALSWAVLEGHEEVIRALVQCGADISTVDCEGWTLVPSTAYEGHEIVVQVLLKNHNGSWDEDMLDGVVPEEHKILALLPRIENIESPPSITDQWALQRWQKPETVSAASIAPSSSSSSASTQRAFTRNSSISTYYTSDDGIEEEEDEEEDVSTIDRGSISTGDYSSYSNSCSEFGSSWGIVSHGSGEKGKRKAADSQADPQQNSFTNGAQNNGQGDGSDDPSDRRQKKRRNRRQAPTPSLTDSGGHRPYACPYYKNNPQDYSSCAEWSNMEIHRVKEHCRRAHLKPTQCPRCSTFRTGDKGQLTLHLRGADCSKAIEFIPIESEDINKGKLLEKKCKYWKQIYMILFPDCHEDDVPDPYLEDHIKEPPAPIDQGVLPLQARGEITPAQLINDHLEFLDWCKQNMYTRFWRIWQQETGRYQLQESIDEGVISGSPSSVSPSNLLELPDARPPGITRYNPPRSSDAGSSRDIPHADYGGLQFGNVAALQPGGQWEMGVPGLNEGCGYEEWDNGQNLCLTPDEYLDCFPNT